MQEEKLNAILNEEEMLERGKFVANGYEFTVKPVYLGEEDEYLSQMTVSPIINGENTVQEHTEKELSQWAIVLFSRITNSAKKRKTSKFIMFFKRLIFRNNYRCYDDYPTIQPLIKWLEKKVYYKGRRVKFYELERKFGLSKAEIEKLIIYFHQLSGF